MVKPLPPEISGLLEQIVPGHIGFLEYARLHRRLYRGPKVLVSDSSFAISGVAYQKTPILVDAYGDIIEAPSKWFVYLRTAHTARGSVLQYASALCSFWRHLQQVACVSWEQVDDGVLRDWRNRMVAGVEREKLLKRQRTVNKKLYVVVDFYKWSQEHGYVKNIIGVTPPGKMPFPIRLVEVISHKQRHTKSHLFYKTRNPSRLPVPTSEEIDRLYLHLSGPHPADHRNVLLARWTLDSGMRKSEILDLLITDLPTVAECQVLKDSDRMHWLPIVGKGAKPRFVPVTADVLLETHIFVTSAGAALSSRDKMLKRRKKWSKEDHIFLSSTSGEPLNPQSISHIFADAFLMVTGRKDRRNLHFHRLRGRFASKLVQELALQTIENGRSIFDLDEQRLILERAADILGHEDTKTLRYYLNAFIDRDEVAVFAAAGKSRRSTEWSAS